ncbi:MAG: hypothetical protein ACOZQL_32100 [Myxococcota bacterium]
MKRSWILGAVVLAACSSEREAALAVTVTLEQGTISTHVVVSVKGGERVEKTECMPVAGQKVLDVAVAQAGFPAEVTLWADGFVDDACATPTDPIENSVVLERRFRKGVTVDAPLVLRQVRPRIETDCTNGLDDDNDGLTDCVDLDCTARTCSTGNACVEGQVCLNGTCQGGARVTCETPPSSCFMGGGLCVVDAGCRYLPNTGAACDAGNECVTGARCDNTGECVGQVRECTTPPMGAQCVVSVGVCVRGSGCVYAPDVDAGCDDRNNCTLDDRCDGDAGCTGTPVSCPPHECELPTGTCTDAGSCVYRPLDAGLPCGNGGACNSQGGCLPPFPFVPSNVAINEIPTPSSGKVTYGCGTTIIDSSGTGAPTVTNACPGQPTPGWANVTQSGGIATLVLAYDDFEVAGGSTLSLIGSRPVIIVSMSDVRVLGAIQVAAGAQACSSGGAGGNGSGAAYRSGGGGGGFGSAGGAGGSVTLGASGGAGGAVNLGTQLRGGCPGGLGGGSNDRPAAGGGALQLVALDSIILAGVITAPGQGGSGGGFANGGNGGGSGGELLLEAQQVIASGGALTCNGGGGGESNTMNAGQSGQATALPARGGSDQVTGGAGGDGAAGTTAAETGEGSSLVAGGGGGGGGVGRIRVNVTNGCNIGPQVVISPPATSNKADAGCP